MVVKVDDLTGQVVSCSSGGVCMAYIAVVITVVVCFSLILIIRALRFVPAPADAAHLPVAPVDIDTAVRHLSEAVTYRTIAYPDEDKVDWDEFDRFHKWLADAYPAVTCSLERETVSRASLIYKWTGRDPALMPFAMLAHMDVVPVEESTLENWTHPPFAGVVDNDTVWGRGANDMKNQLVAIFEAIETLLNESFTPERDVYICIGHNEEVQIGDRSGARAMARLLQQRGVRLEFVFDEGGAILENPPFGLSKPVAMIGLAEKGYTDFCVSVLDAGGHSAEPPRNTALGKLAMVLAAIEKRPMKQRLISPVTLTFDALGRYMGFTMRLVLANLWLFKPLALRSLAANKQTNSMTRTTIAATMAEASPASNILPQKASATLNVRILPGETSGDVKSHIERVASKTAVEIELDMLRGSPAVGERVSAWAYQAILRYLPAVREGVIPAPYLVTGATDSREYEPVADEIYRFYPFILSESELDAMHATDERIRRESLAGALRFNYHFIKEASSGSRG